MSDTSDSHARGLSKPISRRALGKAALAAGAAAAAAATPFNILRAQGGTLKIGMILPKSGFNAAFGQSCQRGADIALEVVREMGYTAEVEMLKADTESNVDVARSRAEALISEGANVLIGAFDSGQTAAIAQVAEQHGVPLVINIAAADQLTQQGYKYVFRNFTSATQLIGGGLKMFKDLFAETGHTPKTAALLHLNDTYGQSAKAALDKLMVQLDMPFKIVAAIPYDPTTKDLSVEVARAKASGGDFLMNISRINDGILMVKECVRQRWEPMGIMCPGGPGMYDQQFIEVLGKYSEYCLSNTPWVNPKSQMIKPVMDAFAKAFPKEPFAGNALNAGCTVEAVMVAVDAYKRAGSTRGTDLAQALRTTDIKSHLMVGGPIQFDANGQNDNISTAGIQNRHRKPTVVLPKSAAEMPPVFPMPGWDSPERT